jgi:hypothetical protein
MPGEARWFASTRASALHAAEVLLAGRATVDPKLGAALSEQARLLAEELEAIGIAPADFFAHAIPLTTRFDSHTRLAAATLTKLVGARPPGSADALLSGRLLSMTDAMHAAYPGLVDELELRSGPLREQWEARGAGLLATVRRLTEEDVVVEAADVVLVQPALGGGGGAHPPYNLVHFEAVLANPHPELPEVARLGWFWAQLNRDLPKYEESIGRERMTHVGPLAVLPPVLAAAEEVELLKFDARLLEAALLAWDAPAADPAVLMNWWDTYHASRPAWSVALAALEQMV